ncbi:MAG: DUF362 domain-containing protein [Kiritimatiellae bacterium]|nr:DUF362 domain-containing protein [Kiritimatiellia bacterium]
MADVLWVRYDKGESFAKRVSAAFGASAWCKRLKAGCLVAVKIHFGEAGKRCQIRPEQAAWFIKGMKARRAKPFLVETSTLYVGERSNAYDHLCLAYAHGYTYEAVGAPIIMADGLLGQAQARVKVSGEHYDEVWIASDARLYDTLLVLSHATGHCLTGFGGTLKNLGMGLASRAGKRAQHAALKPAVQKRTCTACGRCTEWCPAEAITLPAGAKAARVDQDVCIGCGECLAVCPAGAIKIDWDADSRVLQERMVEHALGVVSGKAGRVLYVLFLTNMTRDCDCMGHDNKVRTRDVGVLISEDPVAIDQAGIDLVNTSHGGDFWRECWPEYDCSIQLAHAEKLGLGSRAYALVES